MPTFQNREEWLEAAADALRNAWQDQGIDVPSVRVGVGFTSSGMRGATAGECWPRAASPDDVNEITIPLVESDPVNVLRILCIQLIAATDDGGDVAHLLQRDRRKSIGFDGIDRQIPTNVLNENLTQLAQYLGEYPGDSGLMVKASEEKKQETRMIRLCCGRCGMIFRTTVKWVRKAHSNFICPNATCGGSVAVGD
jgi:hypothetical protein